MYSLHSQACYVPYSTHFFDLFTQIMFGDKKTMKPLIISFPSASCHLALLPPFSCRYSFFFFNLYCLHILHCSLQLCYCSSHTATIAVQSTSIGVNMMNFFCKSCFVLCPLRITQILLSWNFLILFCNFPSHINVPALKFVSAAI